MGILFIGVNKNITDVHKCFVKAPENVIHHPLEGNCHIPQFKKHVIIFK